MSKTITKGWSDYELLDAGGGKKLERWGEIITIRPELQAYFKSEWSFGEWKQKAHFEFESKTGKNTGSWKKLKQNAPENWEVEWQGLKANLELTKFKHLGMFPEQATNWEFIQDNLSDDKRFLNLFAYTGFASVVARNSGAETIHVDSVKQLITWAKTNMVSSEVEGIKWVHEDALKFALREVKRGNKYDGIIMDPPAFGLGAKGERWKIEQKLPELIETASKLLTKDGFLILNTYSPRVSIEDIHRIANRYFSKKNIELTELWMNTSTQKQMFYGHLLRVS